VNKLLFLTNDDKVFADSDFSGVAGIFLDKPMTDDNVRLLNPYPGINAHLNSQLQNDGTWSDFHTVHIGDITKALKKQLLPMGYTVGIDRSLQIRRPDDSVNFMRGDVVIYDKTPNRPEAATTLELVMPIADLIELEETLDYKAIGVYQLLPNKRQRGQLVAWLELLSPSNKPPHSDYREYQEKRHDLLHSGVVFIEIDYLHQFPPTFRQLANYCTFEADSHPYRIAVIDPHPDIQTGKALLKQFDVDDVIPTVAIPLSANDSLKFDFGQPYNATFEGLSYGAELDYTQLPILFETYSPADRVRIQQRMATLIPSSPS
jgi:hypothetical protein